MGIGGSENNQPMDISFSQPPSSLTNIRDPSGWYIENYRATENLGWLNYSNDNGGIGAGNGGIFTALFFDHFKVQP